MPILAEAGIYAVSELLNPPWVWRMQSTTIVITTIATLTSTARNRLRNEKFMSISKVNAALISSLFLYQRHNVLLKSVYIDGYEALIYSNVPADRDIDSFCGTCRDI